MYGITLVFTICSVIIAGAHFALVNGEAAPDQLESPVYDQEVSRARSVQANARAHTPRLGNGVSRLRPVNPYPLNHEQLFLRNFGSNGSCYSCEECFKVDSSTPRTDCPLYFNSHYGCVTYSEETHMSKNKPVRGCISELGTCEEIRKKHQKDGLLPVISCTECYKDNCNDKNGAGSAVLNHITAAMAMLVAPILTKVYFSTM